MSKPHQGSHWLEHLGVWLLVARGWYINIGRPWGRLRSSLNRAVDIYTLEKSSTNLEQSTINTEQLTNSPKNKKEEGKEDALSTQHQKQWQGQMTLPMLLFFLTDLPKTPTLSSPDTNPFLKPHLYSWSPASYTFPSSPHKPRSCWLILLPFQVQKRTMKVKRSRQRHSRKKSPEPSPSCSRKPDIAVRPMIFICNHKLHKTHNEYKHNRNNWPWKIQPFQVTSCSASKCRAWVKRPRVSYSVFRSSWEETVKPTEIKSGTNTVHRYWFK